MTRAVCISCLLRASSAAWLSMLNINQEAQAQHCVPAPFVPDLALMPCTCADEEECFPAISPEPPEPDPTPTITLLEVPGTREGHYYVGGEDDVTLTGCVTVHPAGKPCLPCLVRACVRPAALGINQIKGTSLWPPTQAVMRVVPHP